jgi:general secretion pathway protein D
MTHRLLHFVCITLFSTAAFAAPETFKFQFVDKPVADVVEHYSKKTKQKFVIDTSLRGKVTLLSPNPVTAVEAFDLLSRALARQGFAISEQSGVFVVMHARDISRSKIEVTEKLPAIAPERMVTWVVKLKHAKADSILKNLRILPSKDGELSTDGKGQLILTDWVSNIVRVAEIIAAIDVPSGAVK